MKIFWTYIVNTKDEQKMNTILGEILPNHGEVYKLEKKIYWKDTSKYYVTFYSRYDSIDLNKIITETLYEISYHWNFNVNEAVAGISAVTNAPRNFKVFWVSFLVEG